MSWRKRVRDAAMIGMASAMLSGEEPREVPRGPDSISTEINKNTVDAPQRKLGETNKDYGKRMCDSLGEGTHMFSSPDGDFGTIHCHYTGGYEIVVPIEDEDGAIKDLIEEEYDMVPPTSLDNPAQVFEYMQDKDVVTVGVDHNSENSLEEADRLEQVLQAAAKSGYTTLAIEMNRKYQDRIDQYVAEGDRSLLQNINYPEDAIDDFELQIRLAVANGFVRVVCIDFFIEGKDTQESFPVRDKKMAEMLGEVLAQDERVVVVVGAAHARRSKETTFFYEGDDPMTDSRGVQILQEHVIKPLQRYLIDSYGEKRVGSISLLDQDRDIPTYIR